MKDYMLLMHTDVTATIDDASWGPYFQSLHASGRFDGGSAIGAGRSFRKAGAPLLPVATLDGFIRVRAESLEAARTFLSGNPVYEAGGTVEIRELPADG